MTEIPTLTELFQSIVEAHALLRPRVAVTPLMYSAALSRHFDCELYLKCEHLQHTGSFKFRGAVNKLRQLTAEQRSHGIITASSGNHGQAMALAGKLAGVPVTVYTAADASPAKLDAIKGYGARVITLKTDPLTVELAAAQEAAKQGKLFVSPYNDADVIAGQGTIGMELYDQIPALDAVFVAVGGGGMISGIGTALGQLCPSTRIIGCWPAAAPAMHACLKAGEIIDVPESPTLSDGTAGGVEPGSITFPLCQQVIADSVLVSEQDIRHALQLIARYEHWIVEGAAGVALAGLQRQASAWRGKRVAVILCGRNITLEKFVEAVQ